MTRGVLLLSVSLMALGGVASAQDLRALHAQNAAAQAAEDARRDLLSSQIETSNANERAGTALRLRELDAQRAPNLRPLTVPPPRTIDDSSQRDAALSASSDRLERLTQDALAESNARMRAIKPASQPKLR